MRIQIYIHTYVLDGWMEEFEKLFGETVRLVSLLRFNLLVPHCLASCSTSTHDVLSYDSSTLFLLFTCL